ncbi:hypothetical protein AVEN_3693-1 [Araneus ventricosus]|uniref:Uncharacterized protein n=1 Tax=Araneus ventricosus TaxID=182803 RepID=A0A4Y2MYT2_ARAVE|nr:hypothetical protein AVEN_3693-1 [Araneus ventricosus]
MGNPPADVSAKEALINNTPTPTLYRSFSLFTQKNVFVLFPVPPSIAPLHLTLRSFPVSAAKDFVFTCFISVLGMWNSYSWTNPPSMDDEFCPFQDLSHD